MKSELLNQGESPGRLDSGIWARASFSVATGTQDPWGDPAPAPTKEGCLLCQKSAFPKMAPVCKEFLDKYHLQMGFDCWLLIVSALPTSASRRLHWLCSLGRWRWGLLIPINLELGGFLLPFRPAFTHTHTHAKIISLISGSSTQGRTTWTMVSPPKLKNYTPSPMFPRKISFHLV